MHPAQPARARPAQQPQQKRFGLIVFRVGDRDHCCVGSSGGARKKFVAGIVRRVLDGDGRCPRTLRDIGTLDVERHVEAGSKLPAELFVGIRLNPAQLMVQMYSATDVKTLSGRKFPKRQQQRHGIGTA